MYNKILQKIVSFYTLATSTGRKKFVKDFSEFFEAKQNDFFRDISKNFFHERKNQKHFTSKSLLIEIGEKI